jgi:hypothetical protein
MYASRFHPSMTNSSSEKSLEVVICKNLSPEGGFNIAMKGGFLTDLGSDFYKCKRILAENLNLHVIGNYPVVLY